MYHVSFHGSLEGHHHLLLGLPLTLALVDHHGKAAHIEVGNRHVVCFLSSLTLSCFSYSSALAAVLLVLSVTRMIPKAFSGASCRRIVRSLEIFPKDGK